jgi:hypothetical protein
MKAILSRKGIQLAARQAIAQRDTALSGDMVLVITPATLASSAIAVNAAIGGTALKFTRDVRVELQDAAGNVHDWYDGTISLVASKTGNGTVAMKSGNPTVMTNGVALSTIELTGSWASGNTAIVTASFATPTNARLGFTVAAKTSTDTLTT